MTRYCGNVRRAKRLARQGQPTNPSQETAMPTMMDARIPADQRLSEQLLDQFDLKRGDLVLVEEQTDREERRYVGRVSFAYVTQDGGVRVTIAGASGWAPGSCSVLLLEGGIPEYDYSTIVRKLDADDRVLYAKGGHWSHTVNTPLNSRVEL